MLAWIYFLLELKYFVYLLYSDFEERGLNSRPWVDWKYKWLNCTKTPKKQIQNTWVQWWLFDNTYYDSVLLIVHKLKMTRLLYLNINDKKQITKWETEKSRIDLTFFHSFFNKILSEIIYNSKLPKKWHRTNIGTGFLK